MPSKTEFSLLCKKYGLSQKIFVIPYDNNPKKSILSYIDQLKDYPYVTIRTDGDQKIGLPYIVRVKHEEIHGYLDNYIERLENISKLNSNLRILIHGTYYPVIGGVISHKKISCVLGDAVGLLRYGDVFAEIENKNIQIIGKNIFYEFVNNKVNIKELTEEEVIKYINFLSTRLDGLYYYYGALTKQIGEVDICFLVYDNGNLSFFNTFGSEKLKKCNTQTNKRIVIKKDDLLDMDELLLRIYKEKPEEVVVLDGGISPLSHIAIILRELGIKIKYAKD